MNVFVFFFSSRRRHTRFSRDWSSDVCSSDLTFINSSTKATSRCCAGLFVTRSTGKPWKRTRMSRCARSSIEWRKNRSEERRVGKECRSRWEPYEQKKNTVRNSKTRKYDEDVD